MRIAAYTFLSVIGHNEWSSCRYTKGEGFDLLENSSGVFVKAVKVYCDDPSALETSGVRVSGEMEIIRVHDPRLDYLIDVDAVQDSVIPSVCDRDMTPSHSDAVSYLLEKSITGAEAVNEKDDSFTLVEFRVTLEAFSDVSL